MTTLLVRTVIIYLFLISIMRLMGKRQLGELEVSELVSTILLSDIAALPITDPAIPLMYAVIPIITITAFEVGMSLLLTKVRFFKNILSARPAMLIQKGRINKKELLNNRISIEELLSVLRQQGVADVSEVEYAILEQNGKMTVLPKRLYSQPTCEDLGLCPKESGICHILISDGKIDRHGLQTVGKNEEWLARTLKSQSIAPHEVFLMTLDDAGQSNIIKRSQLIE